jgi:hypothetical protein
MTDLKLYVTNTLAIIFSVMENVNIKLQTFVLILTIIYTIINIIKKVKK